MSVHSTTGPTLFNGLPSIFVDKIAKATHEIKKTNERLTKLQSQKKFMEMQLPLLVKKDKPIAGNSLLKDSSRQRKQSSEETSNQQTSDRVKEQSAQDSVIQLKISRIEGLRIAENGRNSEDTEQDQSSYPREELLKCYIRILLDDDNYNTGFGRIVERDDDSGQVDLEWEEQIFVKVGNDRDIQNSQIYIIVCINTENEISYLDKMISTYELNLIDYTDQRSRLISYDLEDENKIAERDLTIPKETLNLPKFQFTIRYCYSRVLFQQGLLMDLSALIEKEHEYLQYLQNCIQAINEVIVRTQAIVRGYLQRVKFLNFSSNQV